MENIKQILDQANWFSALGLYHAVPGQLALPDLHARADMEWLPSSRDQDDPIHGEVLLQLLRQNGASWQQQVMSNYKLALQSLRAVPDKAICAGRNDFTPAAIGAALYCVRMASIEVLAQREGFWLAALDLYRHGHWPCGRLADGTLAVY